MLMIYFSIALFSLAACFGVALLISWLRKKELNVGVVYSHGAIAIAALVILAAYSIMHPDHFPLISLVLFGMGVIAGLYMFFRSRNDKKKKRPISVAFIHAFFVLTGFATLLFFTFR